MPRIKMLRTLGVKKDTPKRDHRVEGREYTVKEAEARSLIAQGLAIDLDAPPTPVDEDEDEFEVEGDDEEEDLPPLTPLADDLDGKTVPELRLVVSAEGITTSAVRKDDLIKAIRQARQDKAGG